MAEIEDDFPIVAFDRENFREDRLQPGVLALGRRHVLLQEIDVGVELHFDQVRRVDDFFDFPEVDTFCCDTI